MSNRTRKESGHSKPAEKPAQSGDRRPPRPGLGLPRKLWQSETNWSHRSEKKGQAGGSQSDKSGPPKSKAGDKHTRPLHGEKKDHETEGTRTDKAAPTKPGITEHSHLYRHEEKKGQEIGEPKLDKTTPSKAGRPGRGKLFRHQHKDSLDQHGDSSHTDEARQRNTTDKNKIGLSTDSGKLNEKATTSKDNKYADIESISSQQREGKAKQSYNRNIRSEHSGNSQPDTTGEEQDRPQLRKSLGNSPEVEAMSIKDADDLANASKADRKYEQGWQQRLGAKPRTELAQHIPEIQAQQPGGDKHFEEWFDSLTPKELDQLWNDVSTDKHIGAREVIEANVRAYNKQLSIQDSMIANDPNPGGYHEWLKVSQLPKFKEWGISMQDIRKMRTLTKRTVGIDFKHKHPGGKAEGRMHSELDHMIETSDNFQQYKQKLNDWADVKLGGREHLPEKLQLSYQDLPSVAPAKAVKTNMRQPHRQQGKSNQSERIPREHSTIRSQGNKASEHNITGQAKPIEKNVYKQTTRDVPTSNTQTGHVETPPSQPMGVHPGIEESQLNGKIVGEKLINEPVKGMQLEGIDMPKLPPEVNIGDISTGTKTMLGIRAGEALGIAGKGIGIGLEVTGLKPSLGQIALGLFSSWLDSLEDESIASSEFEKFGPAIDKAGQDAYRAHVDTFKQFPGFQFYYEVTMAFYYHNQDGHYDFDRAELKSVNIVEGGKERVENDENGIGRSMQVTLYQPIFELDHDWRETPGAFEAAHGKKLDELAIGHRTGIERLDFIAGYINYTKNFTQARPELQPLYVDAWKSYWQELFHEESGRYQYLFSEFY